MAGVVLSDEQVAFLKSKSLPYVNLNYDDMEQVVDEMSLVRGDNWDMAEDIITTITMSKEWLE